MGFDIVIYGLIGLSFLIAGFVKGVVGLGLPTVSLALLILLIDLSTAMALIVLPSLFTNVWQAIAGGNTMILIRRFWPFFLGVVMMVWLGVAMSGIFEAAILTRVLGGILLIYSIISLYAKAITIPDSLGRWLAPIFGALNGVLTGLTGCLFMPGVIYLQATRLSRDQLVQAMGILFALSTVALGVCLQEAGRMNTNLWQISLLSLFPALLGMQIGRLCRKYLSESVFRGIFLYGLAGIGLYIIIG